VVGSIKIKIDTKGLSYFVCPNCKGSNRLGVYWTAHQHVELQGPCKTGCGATFTISGRKIVHDTTPSAEAGNE
jgi:hypothetical protein